MRAEQKGQVFTNLPKARYADARFDDIMAPVHLPPLKKDIVEDGGMSSTSPYFSPISPERMDIQRWSSTCSSSQTDAPLPFAQEDMPCGKCYSPTLMKKIYACEFVGNILSHSCSICGDSLSKSATVKALAPSYRYPVSHECEGCGWKVCMRCNMSGAVTRQIEQAKISLANEIEAKYKAQIFLLEKQVEGLTPIPGSVNMLENRSPSSSSITTMNADLVLSFKEKVVSLESQLVSEIKAKEHLSGLLTSMQKEFIQYKTDVEMHLESNAAEQVLLQSRLVEQSVLLADARARIDELSSTQRHRAKGSKRDGDGLTQREALLINENHHLKEEIDSLKVSIHLDFDNWKRVVLKQVKAECFKYRDRLRSSLRLDGADDVPLDVDTTNEKELDFLFEQVDWTGGTEELKQTPQRMKAYIESTRASSPEPICI